MSKLLSCDNFCTIRTTNKSLIVTLRWQDAPTETLYFYHTKDFNDKTNFDASWNDYFNYQEAFLNMIRNQFMMPYRRIV